MSVGGAAQQKAAVSRMYDEIAAKYDHVGPPFYARVGAELVARLGLRAGEQVLDAGCGRGACLFPAARAVAPDGHVTGIDVSPGMVEQTRADAERLGLGNVTVTVGDAESPGFADARFDAVLSGFVLRLLPDPGAALRAYTRILRPGGRLGATIFVSGFAGKWQVVGEALESFVTAGAPASPDAFGTVAEFGDLLRTAGFQDVSVADEPHDIELADLDQWWEYLWYSGYRGTMNRIEPARREAARHTIIAAAAPLSEKDGSMRMRVHVRVATGHRAG